MSATTMPGCSARTARSRSVRSSRSRSSRSSHAAPCQPMTEEISRPMYRLPTPSALAGTGGAALGKRSRLRHHSAACHQQDSQRAISEDQKRDRKPFKVLLRCEPRFVVPSACHGYLKVTPAPARARQRVSTSGLVPAASIVGTKRASAHAASTPSRRLRSAQTGHGLRQRAFRHPRPFR